MLYSETVTYIRTHTHEELEIHLKNLAREKVCFRSTGTSRICYVFDSFVVKLQYYPKSDANSVEYWNYANYVTGVEKSIPIARTRKYLTADNWIVLIQERLTDIICDLSREHRRDPSINQIPQEAIHLYHTPIGKFDGLQAGKNRRGQYVFFDVGSMHIA